MPVTVLPPAKKRKKKPTTPFITVLPKKNISTTDKRLAVAVDKVKSLQYIISVQKAEIRIYRLRLNKIKQGATGTLFKGDLLNYR